MIVREDPDAANFVEMSLDPQGPAIQRRLSFPEQLAVPMNPLAIAVVLAQRVTEQAQVKKIGRDRLELERRLVAFVERAGVGPNPADAVFFQQMNDRTLMPAGMAKFNRKAKIRRQLGKEFAESALFISRRIGRRKLNQDERQ